MRMMRHIVHEHISPRKPKGLLHNCSELLCHYKHDTDLSNTQITELIGNNLEMAQANDQMRIHAQDFKSKIKYK